VHNCCRLASAPGHMVGSDLRAGPWRRLSRDPGARLLRSSSRLSTFPVVFPRPSRLNYHPLLPPFHTFTTCGTRFERHIGPRSSGETRRSSRCTTMGLHGAGRSARPGTPITPLRLPPRGRSAPRLLREHVPRPRTRSCRPPGPSLKSRGPRRGDRDLRSSMSLSSIPCSPPLRLRVPLAEQRSTPQNSYPLT